MHPHRVPVLVLLLVLPLFACSEGGSEGQGSFPQMQEDSTIPAVEVVEAQQGSLPLSEDLSGVIRAENEVVIQSEISGRVEEVFVENGDSVNQGDKLIRMEDDQLQAQVRQAEANLRSAEASVKQSESSLRELEAQLERNENLAEDNPDAISELELETLRAQVAGARADLERAKAEKDSAEATLEERRNDLENTLVRAPVKGVVGRRNVEVGMQINSSRELFIIGDISRARVHVVLTERMLKDIEVGQRAIVRPDAIEGAEWEATVDRISPFLEDQSFATQAELELEQTDPRLRSGMYANVSILYGESQEATIVPNAVLDEDPATGRTGVFVSEELSPEHFENLAGGEEDSSAPLLTEPVPFEYREITIVARGRATSGIEGIEPGDFVIGVGQGLLSRDAEPEENRARAHLMSRDRLLEYQRLREEDLVDQFLERQQELIESMNAENDSDSSVE